MYINKLLTKVNYNKKNDINRIKYIVVHYVGSTGDAEANCKYFEKLYRGSSAHYFVGHKGDIWQCVEDANVAWHCGAIKYKHKECRNSNSIGVEMCVKMKNGKWYFEEATVASTLALVKELMKKYNVPAANVIRHYDVTGKSCPEPYVRDAAAWDKFKASLTNTVSAPTGSYKVRVTANKLNVRIGASINYNIVTVVKKGEVYTIVEEKDGWGKLKSGAGWIKLSYTERV